MDVTSGYFSNFSPPREELARFGKTCSSVFMTYGLRGTLPRTGIYISPFTLLIFHRSVAHRGKKRNANGDRELFALRMLLHFFSKSIKTYRLGCAPRFMELSRDRTDCIFGFFFFFFLFPFSSSSLDRRKIFRPRRLSSLYVDSKSVDTKGT